MKKMTESDMLEILSNKYTECEAQIKSLQQDVSDLRVAIYKIKWNLEVGTIVKSKDILHRVIAIERYPWNPFSESKPWITAVPMKKDGTYGIQNKHLYSDWEVVTI